MRRLLPILLAPVLGSCGLIPLPEVRSDDFYVVNTVADLQPHEVLYMDFNQMDAVQAPDVRVSRVTLDASLTGLGDNDDLRLQLFVARARPACPVIPTPAEYVGYSGALRCTDPAGGEPLAELTVKRGLATPVHMEGAVLDRAVQARRVYLGVRVLRGTARTGPFLKVSTIRLNGRF